jgi:hypothetical protein
VFRVLLLLVDISQNLMDFNLVIGNFPAIEELRSLEKVAIHGYPPSPSGQC